MSDWPESLTVAPIREWPGVRTQTPRPSPFRYGGKPVKLTSTLADLDTELRAIHAKDAELLVAIDPSKFRLDGRPYANAQATHPGVILSFEIPKVGRVSYPCDTFTTWEDNLRAIVLALEALRKVDRYGVGRHNDQYRGYLAIEARPTGAFTSDEAAMRFLMEAADMIVDPMLDVFAAYDADDRSRIARKALFKLHPDQGGDAEQFQKAMAAKVHLGANGLL
ncbi:DnaJ-like chaperonin [Microbacterium phage Fizzles]|nr:DnaJ-like chaperonin [Microbacterium phage Fizzles]